MSFMTWLRGTPAAPPAQAPPAPDPAAPPAQAPPAPDPLAMAETLLEPFEGFCNRPYRCPAGVWTIGLGSTRDGDGNPVTPSTPPIDLATARGWAMRDMRAALTSVRAGVTVPLTANEEAALTDFVYNVGAGNFAKSNVLRDLNAGRLQQAADDLMMWNHGGGVVLAGLTRRRAAERALILKA